MSDALRAAVRWRLLLGRHAEEPLPLDSDGDADRQTRERDRVLSFLYDREHASRGHQRAGTGTDGFAVPTWLRGVRTLFPREAAEVLERDALVRYGLTELVTDAEVLRTLEPTVDLVGVILALKSQMAPPVLDEARRIVRQVVDKLASELRLACEPALLGASDPERGRPLRTFRNVNWHATVRRNLSRWDPDRRRLVVDRVTYRHRQRARASTRVILAVDQSGSMAESLVHAAVTAAILASVPAVSVDLLLWDHRVVDMSGKVHDPLEVLLAAQLGGGTHLLPALQACAERVTVPERTVLAIVSDFYVYDAAAPSLELAKELVAEGVRCFGFCALGPDGRGAYDERFGRMLAGAGWWVGAVTPRAFAERIGRLLG